MSTTGIINNNNVNAVTDPNDLHGIVASSSSATIVDPNRNQTTGTVVDDATAPTITAANLETSSIPSRRETSKNDDDNDDKDVIIINDKNDDEDDDEDRDDGGEKIDDDDDDDDDVEIGGKEATPRSKKRHRRVYNGMIECSVEPFRALITCTLCEGLYREPYTTLKCFHTFCKSCLITAIRASYNTPQYNSCPICQTYFGRDDIVTSCALPDRVLEALIDKVLFPHSIYQDYLLECEFYNRRNIPLKDNISTIVGTTTTMKGSAAAAAPTTAIAGTLAVIPVPPPTIETTAVNLFQSNNNRNSSSNSSSKRPAPISIVLDNDLKKMISFHLIPLRPHSVHATSIHSGPLPGAIPILAFETTAQTTIAHIKKLLSTKIFPNDTVVPYEAALSNNNQPRVQEFEIYCKDCLLEDELSLNFISHVIWDVTNNNNNTSINNVGPNDINKINEPTLTLEYKIIT